MKNRISDFDISLGWGIYGPLSSWLVDANLGPPLSEITRLRKRGLLRSVRGRITILGLFIDIQLGTVSKSL